MSTFGFKAPPTIFYSGKHTYEPSIHHIFNGGIRIRAIILAAGRGERVGPLTDSVPKTLIPFVGLTPLDILLRNLQNLPDPSITIGLGWLGDIIRNHIAKNYPKSSFNLVDVPTFAIGPLETLVVSAGEVEGTTIICPGDLIDDSNFISKVFDSHRSSPDRMITLAYDIRGNRGTPVAINDNGLLLRIGDMSDTDARSGRSAMVLVAEPEFFRICRDYRKKGMTRVQDVLRAMLSEQIDIHTHMINERWFDLDSLSSIFDINQALLSRHTYSKGAIHIPLDDVLEVGEAITFDTGTTLEHGVQIRGPTYIAEGCFIGANSQVGPYVSMESNTTIEELCSLSNMVLFDSAKISSQTKLSNVVVRESRVYTE